MIGNDKKPAICRVILVRREKQKEEPDLELVYLVIVFAVIVVMLNLKPTIKGKKRKMSLSIAILTGTLVAILLYRIPIASIGSIAVHTVFNWKETLSLCLVTYLITFLQRMMEQKRHLHQAQEALSAIFNSRRVNATVAPMLIGLLPSPAAAFIAGDMVNSATENYLTVEERTFVTSYFRHISESFLPTYTGIILALSLSGVATSSFLLGMIVPVIMLFVLGYLIYVRKIPKDTGMPKEEHVGKRWLQLFQSLWAIALVVLLILVFNLPVYVATGIAVVLYFFVNRLSVQSVLPYFASAFEWNIMSNIVVVMFFKNILAESGVISLLPDALQKLPLPLPIVFALIFLIGSVIAGSNGIIAMCIPMAYAAIPDGGAALLVLLQCSSYIAMQVSPVHVCLTLIAEYFHTSLGALVKKALPVLGCFVAFLIPYYYLLTLIPIF
jgi:integral membrane protein (TIGR00529 family)